MPPVSMGVDFHFLFPGGGTASLIIIEERFRQVKGLIIKQMEVLFGWFPVSVWRFLMEQQAKGLAFVPFLIKPLQGRFCGDVGYIAFESLALAVNNKIRIVIRTLSGQYHRVIKSFRNTVQVHFSNQGCSIN